MKKIITKIKRKFCNHQFCSYSDTITIDDKNIPVRIYKCIDCGKIVNIDTEKWYISNKECKHSKIKKINIYVGINPLKTTIIFCKGCNKIIRTIGR